MAAPLTRVAQPLAFEDIYTEYRESIYLYARSRMRSVDAEVVRDLVADVWVKIFEALPGFEDRGLPIEAWLYRSTRNMIVDWIRARKNQQSTVLDLEIHDLLDDDSEREHLDILSDEIVASILASLKGRQRELIRLVYVEGWRLSDVAAEYGETLDATKKMHRRALGRIRTFLETGESRRRRGSRVA